MLKPALTSLSIRPTDGAAIENPLCFVHDFDHQLDARQLSSLSVSTESPKS
jgi:hypothetical protein